MEQVVVWLKANEDLSGWAQFAGTMIALVATYQLARLPYWQRNRQLNASGKRLLQNGYEALESFHRTSAFFLPQAINLRVAALSLVSVANEIDRFPLYELQNQGPRSVARNLVSVSVMLKMMHFYLEEQARLLGDETATEDERDNLREMVGSQVKLFADMLAGKPLKRPEPPFQSA